MCLAIVGGIIAGGCYRHRGCSDSQRIAGRLRGISIVRAVGNGCRDGGGACADDGHLAARSVHSSYSRITGAVGNAAVTCLRQCIRKGGIAEGLVHAGRRIADAAGGFRNFDGSTAGDSSVICLRHLIVDRIGAGICVCRAGVEGTAGRALAVFHRSAIRSRNADAVCLAVVGGVIAGRCHRHRGSTDSKALRNRSWQLVVGIT